MKKINIAPKTHCDTSDLGSRLDTWNGDETEKNYPYPQLASLFLSLKIITKYRWSINKMTMDITNR